MIKTIIILLVIIYGICGISGFIGFIADVIKWHLPEKKEDIISSANIYESEVEENGRAVTGESGRSDNGNTGPDTDTGTVAEYSFDLGNGYNNDNSSS